MGKKSREKRERQKRREMGLEAFPTEQKKEAEPFLFNIIRFGTYLIFLTPLILATKFYFPFVGPKSLYFMGLCQIIFFVWLYLAINYKRYRPKLNPILLAFVLFLIVLILSSVLGVDFSRSFWSKYERMTGLLMWLHLLGFFLVISSTFRKADWEKVFIVSILVSILISLGVILETMGVGILKFSDRGGFTLGNTSFLGIYLLFNVFLALYLFFKNRVSIYGSEGEEENKVLFAFQKSKILFLVPVILGILVMYLQGARASIISTIGGLGLIFLLWLSFETKSRKIRILGRVLLAISTIIVLTSIVLLYLPGNPIHQKFGELSTQSRFVNWEMAQKAFLERPLVGWGPENYDLVFTKFFNPSLFIPEYGGEIWFDRTHNIIFDTLVTTGILGFLAYLGLFFSLFLVLGKKYFKEKSISFWTFSIFVVLPVSYFIQNLTVFDMVASLMMFVLILGFVAFLAGKGKEKQTRELFTPKHRMIGIFLIFIFLFTFSKFIIQPFRADAFVIKALANPQQRIEFYRKALETSPMGKYQIREFFGQNSETIIRENIQQIPKEQIKEELDFVTAELEKTNRESPLDFRSALKLAHLYNIYVLIDPEKIVLAEKYGERAIELSPTNQQAYWALAQTKIYQGDSEKALSLAQKAIELEPRWLQSHEIAIQISQIFGKSDLSRELAEKAIEINPDWQSEFEDILRVDKDL
jgi:O-antigen ligase